VEKDLLTKIYEDPEYYNLVRNTINFAMKRGINSHDLEDCISEVYAAAAAKREELEKHPCVQGWLVLTAKNIARRYKARKQIDSQMLTLADEVLSEVADSSDEEQRQLNETIEVIKKNLRRSDFNLFKMRFIDKLSFEQIAEKTGKSPDAIKSRIKRLRVKLKIFLE